MSQQAFQKKSSVGWSQDTVRFSATASSSKPSQGNDISGLNPITQNASLPLKGKKILVAITGGIAAYKACDLIRLFQRQGAEKVVAMMTPDAEKFVSPLTLESLTMNPVFIKNLENTLDGVPTHIAMAQQMDAMVVIPTTANSLFKLAHGASDNVLTSTALTFTRKPLLICPAMNTRMWENSLTQENLAKIAKLPNVTIVPPDSGLLACGETGAGKLASVEHISLYTQKAIDPQSKKYQGKTINLIGGVFSASDNMIAGKPSVWRLKSNDTEAQTLALADGLFKQGASVQVLLSGDENKEASHLRPYPVMRMNQMDLLAGNTLPGLAPDRNPLIWCGPKTVPSGLNAESTLAPAQAIVFENEVQLGRDLDAKCASC
jgi:phosphopantothenoylcysteine decarboxylase/phosphopantothenate--cysteine ligase